MKYFTKICNIKYFIFNTIFKNYNFTFLIKTIYHKIRGEQKKNQVNNTKIKV